uniref:Uncharacterized protein n=1 Tax=Rhizophora mucronata TaxID=61149 RepID=A0A2P2PGS2_RHIMU
MSKSDEKNKHSDKALPKL